MPEEFFQKALLFEGVAGFGRKNFVFERNFGGNFNAVERVTP